MSQPQAAGVTIDLTGRRALIVGAGQGIGRACAVRLAEAGATVGVLDVRPERSAEAAAEITAAGGRAYPFTADVLALSPADELVERVVSAKCGLDTVVTIVGGQTPFHPFRPTHETSDAALDAVLHGNLGYVLHLLRPVLRLFREQGGGTIVSIGSISGVVSSPNHSAYGAAKAGLINLARSVTAEYGRFGVRMNVVSPGLALTVVAKAHFDAATLEAAAERIPVQHVGAPEDIANAVLFLTSPLASNISGQNLTVDGGILSRYPLQVNMNHPSEGN
jgi:3-oxoacyl-[acyl-carrier protein] reductase